MRTLRPLLITLLLVFGFYAVTNRMAQSAGSSPWPFHGLMTNARLDGRAVPTGSIGITQAEAAPAYDAEELNNIDVYKRGMPSVVNITSTALVFNSFYGRCRSRARARASSSTRAATSSPTTTSSTDANRGIEVKHSRQAQYPATVVGSTRCTIWRCLQIDAPDLAAGHAGRFARSRRRAKRSTPSAIPSACQRHHDPRHHQLHPLHSRRRRRAH